MPDPNAIMQMATGYWASGLLFAANDLNVFGILAEGPLSAGDVAARAQSDLRGMTLLLASCAGMGLLVKEAGETGAVYRNGPEAGLFLVPGRPGSLSGALRWSADQYEAWGRLAASVRSGQPAVSPSLHLGDDPEQTRTFVLAMHERALGMARGVVPFLDLSGVKRLLDVGGGPGTYAALLAQKYPALQVDVLDLPAVAAIAQELIADAGLSDRVRPRPGDAHTTDYGSVEYDAVLFSGVLHQMSADTIAQIFGKAYRAIKPGGRVLISDLMLEADKTRPAFSTLFSLQMLLTSEAGAVFAVRECCDWLAAAGFQEPEVQALPPPLPYTVVMATKPGTS